MDESSHSRDIRPLPINEVILGGSHQVVILLISDARNGKFAHNLETIAVPVLQSLATSEALHLTFRHYRNTTAERLCLLHAMGGQDDCTLCALCEAAMEK